MTTVDWPYTWLGFLAAGMSHDATSNKLMLSNPENFADWSDDNDSQTRTLDREEKTNMSSSSSTSGDAVMLIDWDDWDQSLWTDEQRQLLERGAIPPEVHITLGVFLTLIVLFGVAANSTILYVFARFKRLRTPANVFIINLTISDFLACCLHPLAVYSAFRGRWSFGQTGCNLYGMGVAFFGLNSIVTLSAIACERYIVITSSSCRPAVAKWRITRRQAQKICAGIWLHCAALVTPPWLFGWSSYLPEGVLVTCSWDYTSRTLSNRLYYIYLLLFGFVLPISVLTYCYASIFRFIVRSSREMTRLIMTSDGRMSFSKTTVSFRKRRRQTDVRTALIILSLAMLCYTAWTPYAIVSLIGQFGPVDENGQPKKLSPMATAIPAFLAKTAIVFDPLVYGFSSPQFRNSVRQFFRRQSVDSSINGGIRSGGNNTALIVIRGPVNRNGNSSRGNLRVVFSSLSRSIRMNSNDSASHNKLNESTVSGQHSAKPSAPSDSGDERQQLFTGGGGSLKKSCMKRINSLNIPIGGRNWRRGSGLSKQSQQSLSATDEASVSKTSSLRMLQVQEEADSHMLLLRQQWAANVDKIQRSIKTERMIQIFDSNSRQKQKRRSSEPDLSEQSSSKCSRKAPLGNLTASKSCDPWIETQVLKGCQSCQVVDLRLCKSPLFNH